MKVTQKYFYAGKTIGVIKQSVACPSLFVFASHTPHPRIVMTSPEASRMLPHAALMMTTVPSTVLTIMIVAIALLVIAFTFSTFSY